MCQCLNIFLHMTTLLFLVTDTLIQMQQKETGLENAKAFLQPSTQGNEPVLCI